MSYATPSDSRTRPPACSTRRRLGAAVPLMLLGVLGPLACAQPSGLKSPSHRLDTTTVRLPDPKHSDVRFQIEHAQASPPLLAPAVSGRVTTIDAQTSPAVAPLNGQIVRVAVALGERVKQGAKIALVRTPELAELQRSLRTYDVVLRTKHSTVARLQQLVEQRIAPQQDLLLAQSELDEAQVARDAARARLRSLGIGTEGDTAYWVLASRPGTVVQLSAAPGQLVGPDTAHPVATVANIDEVLVIADLPARAVAGVSAGSRARIANPGDTLVAAEGTVELVPAVMDPDRQTVPIRIRAKNEGHGLRPNAYVDVTFQPASDQPTVQVPASAIVRDGLTAVVFVQVAPDRVRRRNVELGRQTSERVEIRSGLEAGEAIVVSGALLLLNALDIEG